MLTYTADYFHNLNLMIHLFFLCTNAARNLFVQGDERKGYLLKIGDFGSAYMPGDKHKMKSFTLTYCAPEMAQLVLKRKNPDSISQSKQELEQRLQPKTDIFSAGLVVGFMHKGKILLSFLIKSNVSTKSEREQIILKFVRTSFASFY